MNGFAALRIPKPEEEEIHPDKIRVLNEKGNYNLCRSMTGLISFSIFVFLSLLGFLLVEFMRESPVPFTAPWEHVYTARELDKIEDLSKRNLEKIRVVHGEMIESLSRMKAASTIFNSESVHEKMSLIISEGEYLCQQGQLCTEHWEFMTEFIGEGLKIANDNLVEGYMAVASTGENVRRRYKKLYKSTVKLGERIHYYRDQSKHLYELYQKVLNVVKADDEDAVE